MGYVTPYNPPIKVGVDWPDTGNFTEPGTDVTVYLKNRASIGLKRGKDKARSLSPPMAGEMHYTLDNRSRIFSLFNRTSPLATYTAAGDATAISVGHFTRLQFIYNGAHWQYDQGSLVFSYDMAGRGIQYDGGGTLLDLGWAVTDDIPQNSDPDKLDVDMPGIGVMSKLRGTPAWTFNFNDASTTANDPGRISTALYSSITIDVAIGHLLDAAGWPTGKRTLAVSTVVLQWYWEQDADPIQALGVLLNTEGPGAAIYEDASGNFVFENKNYRYTALRSLNSNGIFSDGSVVNSYYFPDAKSLQNLQGYWRLGEGSGTSATDQSANGNTGTYTGGYTLNQTGAITRDPNTAVLFNGSSGTIDLGTPASLINSVAMCAAGGWFKTSSATAQTIFTTSSLIGNHGCILFIDALGHVHFEVFTAGSFAASINPLTNYADGEYHFAVGVYDGSTVYVYVDGLLGATVPLTGAVAAGVHAYIGSVSGSSEWFNGTLDEVFYCAGPSLIMGLSTVSQLYTDAAGSSEPRYQYPFAINTGVKDVVNAVSLDQKTRTQADSLSTVWTGPASLTLTANQTYTIVAKANDPFTGAVAPVGGTDYTVSAGSLASSPTLDRTSGQSCTITLVAGAAGATILNLGLRAFSVPVATSTTIVNSVNTAASQARYGTRPFKLQTRAEVDINTLQGTADAIASQWSTPRPWATVTLVNPLLTSVVPTRLAQGVQRAISDRISLVEQQAELSADAWIDSIGYEVTHNGQILATTYECELISGAIQPFKFDTSLMDGQDTTPAVLWS